MFHNNSNSNNNNDNNNNNDYHKNHNNKCCARFDMHIYKVKNPLMFICTGHLI